MLGENILLTRFEYQWFNGTTKVDTIHIVYILMITRLHLHIHYLKESQEFVYFLEMKDVKHSIDFTTIFW